MKTHYTLMNEADKQLATLLVRKIAATVTSTHAADRMAQKDITGREIEIALTYGRIIEVHDDAGEYRAVIRHDFGRPKVGVVVVISLTTGKIITTWKNAGSDNHRTLNGFVYQKVNLTQLLARG